MVVVRDLILEYLKKVFHCRLAAQTMRVLRHRHNLHATIRIVELGIKDATDEGAEHSCLVYELFILLAREVQANLRVHAEEEPFPVSVAPALRQYIVWHFWTELVGAGQCPQLLEQHLFVLRVELGLLHDILPAVDGFNTLELPVTLRVVLELFIVDVKDLRVLRLPKDILVAPVSICVVRIDDEGRQEVSQPNTVMQFVFEVLGRRGIWDVEFLGRLRVSWHVVPSDKLDTGEEARHCCQDERADTTKSGPEAGLAAVVEFGPRSELVLPGEERI